MPFCELRLLDCNIGWSLLNQSRSRKFSKSLSTSMISTPTSFDLVLSCNHGNAIYQLKYSQIIGNLIYVMYCTRLDIAYNVSTLSNYTNAGKESQNAILRIVRYLKGTLDYGVVFFHDILLLSKDLMMRFEMHIGVFCLLLPYLYIGWCCGFQTMKNKHVLPTQMWNLTFRSNSCIGQEAN